MSDKLRFVAYWISVIWLALTSKLFRRFKHLWNWIASNRSRAKQLKRCRQWFRSIIVQALFAVKILLYKRVLAFHDAFVFGKEHIAYSTSRDSRWNERHKAHFPSLGECARQLLSRWNTEFIAWCIYPAAILKQLNVCQVNTICFYFFVVIFFVDLNEQKSLAGWIRKVQGVFSLLHIFILEIFAD